MLSEVYGRITDPANFFKGWSEIDFTDWLTIREPGITDSQQAEAVAQVIKALEKVEMYEFCAIAKKYHEILSPIA